MRWIMRMMTRRPRSLCRIIGRHGGNSRLLGLMTIERVVADDADERGFFSEGGVARIARAEAGPWLRFVKKDVGVWSENCDLDVARTVWTWVRCAVGGFVLRAGVARMARDRVWA